MTPRKLPGRPTYHTTTVTLSNDRSGTSTRLWDSAWVSASLDRGYPDKVREGSLPVSTDWHRVDNGATNEKLSDVGECRERT